MISPFVIESGLRQRVNAGRRRPSAQRRGAAARLRDRAAAQLRNGASRLERWRQAQKGVAIVLGTGERARRLAEEVDRAGRFRVHGFLDDDPAARDSERLGPRYLGGFGEFAGILREQPVERVLFALPRRQLADEATANLVSTCQLLGIDVGFPSDLFESGEGRAALDRLGSIPALRVGRHRPPGWKLLLKRSLDVAGALAALLLTAPAWLLAALAIKLDSPGPVFFVQTRTGRHGRTFRCIKFRTMVTGAEDEQAALLRQNEQSGPVFKIRNDPRITRVGRVLRRYSIDELPQLLNVLAGQMSLVGPRPPLPAEVAQYEIDHRARLSMRPGITCTWQISGRSEIAFADWVKLDVDYIDRWSLRLDLKILLLTIPAVLSARGAS